MNTDHLDKNLPLSCADFRDLLEDGMPADLAEAAEEHLAACPVCRTEYEILRLMRDHAASDEPPAGFAVGVLEKIRKERARRARLRTLRSIGGAVAAALVLVPALLIWTPMLGDSEAKITPDTTADTRSTAEETENPPLLLYYTAVDTVDDSAAETIPGESKAQTEVQTEAKSEMADSAQGAPAMDFVPPPGYVGNQRAEETTAPHATVITMSVTTAAATAEPAFYQILRDLVGEDAFDAWLQEYTGDPADAESAAYEFFGIEE